MSAPRSSNALSARLDVQVDREGHEWAASFRRGVPGEFAAEGPRRASTRGKGLRQTRKVARKVTGTRIRFWPDRQVFTKDADWSFERARAAGPADRVPRPRPGDPGPGRAACDGPAPWRFPRGWRGERGRRARIRFRCGKEAEFRFDGGISEFCAYLSPGKPLTDVLRLTGAGQFSETVPVLDEQGHMTPTDVERELQVNVALQWSIAPFAHGARSAASTSSF